MGGVGDHVSLNGPLRSTPLAPPLDNDALGAISKSTILSVGELVESGGNARNRQRGLDHVMDDQGPPAEKDAGRGFGRNRTPAMMGVVAYRFTDAFWTAGRRGSAVLSYGGDMFSQVTPSGFFVPQLGTSDEADFVAAFEPYIVQDSRVYDEVVLAKEPRHYWPGPGTENWWDGQPPLYRIDDLGSLPDPLIHGTGTIEATPGDPVVRGSDIAAVFIPQAFTSSNNLRWSSPNWNSIESSLGRANWQQFTYEVWYAPGNDLTRNSTHLGRVSPGWILYHSGRVPRARVYNASGSTFIETGGIASTFEWDDLVAAGHTAIHYAMTSDGSTIRCFINGVERASIAQTPTDIYDPTAVDFSFPHLAGAATVNVSFGALGHIAYYPRALSAAELYENWFVGTP